MRAIDIDKIQPGMMLGKTIHTADGRVLLKEGTALTDRYLKALRDMQFGFLYVKDPRVPDLDVPELIPDELRQEAIAIVRESFTSLKEGKKGLNLGPVMQVAESIVEALLSNDDLTIQLADLRSHDTYTFAHSVNVCVIGTILGHNLGLDPSKLRDLATGLMLHDVGKTAVPQEILNKPGKLTEAEFEKMREHARAGFDSLREFSSLSAHAKIVILQHHEKFDGTGYPKGLKGNDIHIHGQIGAIADVYDALTSDRVYRKRFMPHEAIEFLLGQADSHFSLDLVTAFVASVAPYPPGTLLKLSTGEIGIVTEVDMGIASRPTVKIIQDTDGRKRQAPFPTLDLRRERTITISKVLSAE